MKILRAIRGLFKVEFISRLIRGFRQQKIDRFIEKNERSERLRKLKEKFDLQIEFSKKKPYQPEDNNVHIDWEEPEDNFEPSAVTTCGIPDRYTLAGLTNITGKEIFTLEDLRQISKFLKERGRQ